MINKTGSHRVAFSLLRELNYASINATTFTQVGIPFLLPTRVVMISNLTDADLYISTDGTNNYEVVAGRSYKTLDFVANSGTNDDFEWPVGAVIYVKAMSALPTSGSICVSALHASRN